VCRLVSAGTEQASHETVPRYCRAHGGWGLLGLLCVNLGVVGLLSAAAAVGVEQQLEGTAADTVMGGGHGSCLFGEREATELVHEAAGGGGVGALEDGISLRKFAKLMRQHTEPEPEPEPEIGSTTPDDDDEMTSDERANATRVSWSRPPQPSATQHFTSIGRWRGLSTGTV
jgi:hypothetical protein